MALPVLAAIGRTLVAAGRRLIGFVTGTGGGGGGGPDFGGVRGRVGFRVEIRGVRELRREIRRLERIAPRAHAAALKKVMEAVRGRLRRAIARELAVPLKLTRRRVGWFWKTKRSSTLKPAEGKLWVGTRFDIGPAELPRLNRVPRGQRRLDLEGPASRHLVPLATVGMRVDYPKQIRSQYARFVRAR